MTLKTELMTSLPSHSILKCIKMETLSHNISDQINADFVRIRDFFQKHQTNLLMKMFIFNINCLI